VRRLPSCTEPELDPTASSAEIDCQVKERLQTALSIYRLDLETLRALRPDIILAQAQCEVCAVSLAEVEHLVAGWVGSKPRVLSLSPQQLADVWRDILTVSDALGVAERGHELVKGLQSRVADVSDQAAPIKRQPSVACVEWLDPLMAAGNWVPETGRTGGGLNLFGESGKTFAVVELGSGAGT